MRPGRFRQVLREQGWRIAAADLPILVHPRRLRGHDQRRRGRRRGPHCGVDQSNRKFAAEGLYGRRKMAAHLRRTSMLAFGAVDREMRTLGLKCARRGKTARTIGQDGKRAGDLLNRDFTASEPNRVWITDFAKHFAQGGARRTAGRGPVHLCRVHR